MEATVSATAPTIYQPPGITSLTTWSTAAPASPIAGPGSICANASDTLWAASDTPEPTDSTTSLPASITD